MSVYVWVRRRDMLVTEERERERESGKHRSAYRRFCLR